MDRGSGNSASSDEVFCVLSTSSEVDADPAVQPSTMQQVRRKHHSRKNRYVFQSREKMQERGFRAVDVAAGRDNFRDNADLIARPVTCTLAYT